jgi:uncharacterized coiled-coil protein SlyX
MYISVSEASKKYNKAEKTIRRLYENKTLSRSQAYKNKKNKWKLNTEWLDSLWPDSTTEQKPDNDQPKVDTTNTTQTNDFQSVLAVLEKQLAEKDKQLERLDSKLDQQQKLTAGLQTQLTELNKMLAISAPKEADKTTESIKTSKAPKKPVKRAVNGSKSNNKKQPPKKKKHWWSRS